MVRQTVTRVLLGRNGEFYLGTDSKSFTKPIDLAKLFLVTMTLQMAHKTRHRSTRIRNHVSELNWLNNQLDQVSIKLIC